MMLDFFEKFDMCPMDAKKALNQAYLMANPDHYSNGTLDYSNYSWAIDTLKELIARKEKETKRVKTKAAGVNRRYF